MHVTDAASADHFAAQMPDFARQLMQAFWPGPLTVILPRQPGVAAAAAGDQDSIGLRCPAHPVAKHWRVMAVRCYATNASINPPTQEYSWTDVAAIVGA